jgi:hypothetical protein
MPEGMKVVGGIGMEVFDFYQISFSNSRKLIFLYAFIDKRSLSPVTI